MAHTYEAIIVNKIVMQQIVQPQITQRYKCNFVPLLPFPR